MKVQISSLCVKCLPISSTYKLKNENREKITLIHSGFILKIYSLSVLFLRFSHVLPFKYLIIRVSALVLPTIISEKFMLKIIKLIGFIIPSFYKSFVYKVFFIFFRIFLLSFKWSFRDFTEPNFGCQYWSNLRFLISKIHLWYWQQYCYNTSINNSINSIINILSFSYFIHNRNLKIPFRMKRLIIINFDLLDIFIIFLWNQKWIFFVLKAKKNYIELKKRYIRRPKFDSNGVWIYEDYGKLISLNHNYLKTILFTPNL